MTAITTTGYWSPAATTGYGSPAATTGYRSPAATLGANGWARASAPDGSVTLVDYSGPRHRVLTAYVGEGIAPGRWCTIVNGLIVQPPEVLDIDNRGYVLRYVNGRYIAGCRDFDRDEAIAHWSNPKHESPENAAILLAAVLAHDPTKGQ